MVIKELKKVLIKFFDLQIDNNLNFENVLNILSSNSVKHSLPSEQSHHSSQQDLHIYIPLCNVELLSGTFNSNNMFLPSKRKLLD
jgi:hypothetical protein